MKAWIASLALVPLLGGCTTVFPESPLAADTPEEARCAAIRETTPLHERGTRADPTTYAASGCRTLRYETAYSSAPSSGFHPLRSVFDAAYID